MFIVYGFIAGFILGGLVVKYWDHINSVSDIKTVVNDAKTKVDEVKTATSKVETEIKN